MTLQKFSTQLASSFVIEGKCLLIFTRMFLFICQRQRRCCVLGMILFMALINRHSAASLRNKGVQIDLMLVHMKFALRTTKRHSPTEKSNLSCYPANFKQKHTVFVDFVSTIHNKNSVTTLELFDGLFMKK